MKTISTLIFILFLLGQLSAQKTISGKSAPTRINIQPSFERGNPPNLFAKLSFDDDNKNGILEANETARLILTITNKGKGPAQGLKVSVKDNTNDGALTISDGQQISFIYPEKSVTVTVNLYAGMFIKSAEHKLEINVTEHFGYDMDPAYLMMNTYEFQSPKLAFSGLDIIDMGDGTTALNEDGQIQPGEQVKVKLMVQNIGQGISKNTSYAIKTTDGNIFISSANGNIGDIGIGEVKEIWFTLSPNKRVSTSGNLPVTLSISNTDSRGELSSFQLPLAVNKKPSSANILTVEADLARLQTQVATFVYNSDKISANIANVIDITQAPPSKTILPDAVGIIIGIEKYENFVSAPYAANDAAVMKDYFSNILGIKNEKIWSFTNEKVNGNFFDNKFNPSYGELQKAVNKNQTDVYIFYSGHGIPSKSGNKVYLLPSDGRLEALDKQGYELSTLYNNLNNLQAKSVTVFIDACFSGESRPTETQKVGNLIAAKGARIKPDISQPWLTNPNFTVFSSSDFDETSLGFDASGTGLFTYYLCAGLQGRADADGNKSITAGELFDYISLNVKETSVKIRGLQTPKFNGNKDKILVTF
ncbi:MAG: caspase family protein [Bacteroidales bacterium]